MEWEGKDFSASWFYCHFLLEEAVNKVKIQAMSEVQKAVAEAEQKAFEVIATERARMEQTIADVKRQAAEDAFLVINEQEESTEVRALLGCGLGLGQLEWPSPLLSSQVLGSKGQQSTLELDDYDFYSVPERFVSQLLYSCILAHYIGLSFENSP